MNKKILKLCESAIMIALATVLSLFTFANLPFGGSVTLCSMLPIVLISYRHGLKQGLLTGAVYGLVQMILGAENLTYGTSFIAVACIILFDYIVAFGVIGLSGIFRGKLGNQSVELGAGALLVCVLRYICHFITGITVWASMAPEGTPVWIYSLAYNATYMVPEAIVTVVGAVLIGLFVDFRTEKLSALKHKK